MDDVLVMAGGILPDEDLPAIEAMGIRGNFGPGTLAFPPSLSLCGQISTSRPAHA